MKAGGSRILIIKPSSLGDVVHTLPAVAAIRKANPDAEIFRALRPGLSSIPGAILLNASSPYRKAGVLYQTFKRQFGRDDARVLVWRGTDGVVRMLAGE